MSETGLINATDSDATILSPDTSGEKKSDELALLKQQFTDTQKLLQHEKLKREVLEIMINIAENELKIIGRSCGYLTPRQAHYIQRVSQEMANQETPTTGKNATDNTSSSFLNCVFKLS